MLRFPFLICLLLAICKLSNADSELIWSESFEISDKGVWCDENEKLHEDFTDVDWFLDYKGAFFEDANDYAKTVSTGGGRFEVLDSDGEVVWFSPWINASDYHEVEIGLTAKETGSNEKQEKKYLKAFYKTSDHTVLEFSPAGASCGNWGEWSYVERIPKCDSIQIMVKMNSSYSNDKVILDNVFIRGYKDVDLTPWYIESNASFEHVWVNDTFLVELEIFSKDSVLLRNGEIDLEVESNLKLIAPKHYEEGVYQFLFVANYAGEYKIVFKNDAFDLRFECDVYAQRLSDYEFFEDFEENVDERWMLNGWDFSDGDAIDGHYSLKHSIEATGESSVAIFNQEDYNLDDGDYYWGFVLKNGNWDPSSSNNFSFCLNGEDIHSGRSVDLIFGVNVVGSDDVFSVWVRNKGAEIAEIAKTDYLWGKNNAAEIRIKRQQKGTWELTVRDRNDVRIGKAIFVESGIRNYLSSLFDFNFTSTRAGKLWVDNFSLIRENMPPYVLDWKIQDKKLIVVFNEPILSDQAQLKNFTFSIDGKEWNSFSTIETLSDESVALSIQNIDVIKFYIRVSGIQDVEGMAMAEEELIIQNVRTPGLNDIVINEIMCDPVPSVFLPEVEYIELYNRCGNFICLQNCNLVVDGRLLKMDSLIMKPKSYLVLMDEDAVGNFDENILKMGLSRFPILKNGGSDISIQTEKGEMIDEINYQMEWYHSNDKESGGWSLERIDPNRFCNQWGNWMVSEDESGGSPGKQNTIYHENIDDIPPEIIETSLLSANEIQIVFSEPIDTLLFKKSDVRMERIDFGIQNYKFETEQELIIRFEQGFVENKKYKVELLNVVDGCGNIANSCSDYFRRMKLKPGQVQINEILFNPFSGGSDYVELVNRSEMEIDLSKLRISSRDDSLKLGKIYPFSNEKIEWEANRFLLVTTDRQSVFDNYYVRFPENILNVSRMPSLPDDAGNIVILDDSLNVLDEFVYDATMHSDYISDENGVALERINLDDETFQASNWMSASSIAGYGTPGYENSQVGNEQMKLQVVVFPEVVTPNDDGSDDELTINISNVPTNSLGNIYVFDAIGQLKLQLKNNALLGGNNQIIWDCKDTSNCVFARGPYILLIEIIEPKGRKTLRKQTFYLAS